MDACGDLFAEMTSGCPVRSRAEASPVPFGYVKNSLSEQTEEDVVPWQEKLTRWWRGERRKVAGAFLCPVARVPRVFWLPSSQRRADGTNWQLKVTVRWRLSLFVSTWPCDKLARGRDPALNPEPLEGIPAECRRSGDRMKKEWMDGCQLITSTHQMFLCRNNAACIYCSLRTPKVLLCCYCGSVRLTFEWWDHGHCGP